MPLQSVRKPSKLGGGRKTVIYRDHQGKTWSAIVLGIGNEPNSLNLLLEFPRPHTRIDNVPLATSTKSTHAYFNRLV